MARVNAFLGDLKFDRSKRVSMGFCIVGLYMVRESRLNGPATTDNRGRVFAVYMVINLGAGADLFIIESVLFSLALIPIGRRIAIVS